MERFPDVCPIDGVRIDSSNAGPMVRDHFRRLHRGRTGLAFRKEDAEPFEFCLIDTEPGSSRWRIVVFEWPFEIVLIRPADYRIHWIERDPR